MTDPGTQPSGAPEEARLGLNLIGESPAFRAAMHTIRRLSYCTATVLITGETGTGKEVAARAIHYLSERRKGPFIAINCGAIPDALVESELFGHARGAFTDAKEARPGAVGLARSGTLFLDELEAISNRAQVALLRFLQDQAYQPVGGALITGANVRVIAATNRDLPHMVALRQFREDLYFRLNVLPLALPPLRERGDDVVLLSENFLRRIKREHGGMSRRLSADAVNLMRRYTWPGNIRELENVLLRDALLSDSEVITLASLQPHEGLAGGAVNIDTHKGFREAKHDAVAAFERAYVEALLARTGGNVSEAARQAGKDRSRLVKLLRKYGIERTSFASSFS